jgi:hypothetical protein
VIRGRFVVDGSAAVLFVGASTHRVSVRSRMR